MTAEEYHTNLLMLKNRDPKHRYLERLSSGYSYMNAVYMTEAIDQLPPPIIKEEKSTSVDNPATKQLIQQKMHVSASIRKLSNEFRNCITDADRKRISMKIKKLISKKRDIQMNIEYYETNAVDLPPIPDKMRDLIPDNDLDLHKKEHSLQNSIRYHKGMILRDAKMMKDPDILARREEKLKKLQIHYAYVKEELRKKGLKS